MKYMQITSLTLTASQKKNWYLEESITKEYERRVALKNE